MVGSGTVTCLELLTDWDGSVDNCSCSGLEKLSFHPPGIKPRGADKRVDTLGDSLEVDIVANVRSGERKTPSFKSDERRSKVSRLQAKMAEFRLKHIVFHRSLYIR